MNKNGESKSPVLGAHVIQSRSHRGKRVCESCGDAINPGTLHCCNNVFIDTGIRGITIGSP